MVSTRKELKQRAKESMQGTRPSYLIIGIIMVIAVNAEGWLTALLGEGVNLEFTTYEELMAQLEYAAANISLPLQLAFLALGVFVSVLQFGFMRYSLRLSRGEKEVPVDELISGFQIFWKVVALNLLTGLFIILWSMLFVIPGIVAAYRYRMAQRLLMDHPDWSAMECIRESKRLMQGNKASLFVLDLSFFGWQLLSSLVVMFTFMPVMDIWLMPYRQVTESHFYNELVGWNGQTIAGNENGVWWEE